MDTEKYIAAINDPSFRDWMRTQPELLGTYIQCAQRINALRAAAADELGRPASLVIDGIAHTLDLAGYAIAVAREPDEQTARTMAKESIVSFVTAFADVMKWDATTMERELTKYNAHAEQLFTAIMELRSHMSSARNTMLAQKCQTLH